MKDILSLTPTDFWIKLRPKKVLCQSLCLGYGIVKIRKGSTVTLPGSNLLGTVISDRSQIVKVRWSDSRVRRHALRFLISAQKSLFEIKTKTGS